MSTAIYRWLLRLYPREFRRRWEEEMLDTFALQLADGWWDAWSCAIAELLPASRECLAIPVVSLVGTGTLFIGLLWALGNPFALVSLYHRLLESLGG
jgi:hypothetical protein